MRKAVILIWCILVGWMNSLSAQPQCTVTHYDEFSGMAQWYVTQIVQDQQAYGQRLVIDNHAGKRSHRRMVLAILAVATVGWLWIPCG